MEAEMKSTRAVTGWLEDQKAGKLETPVSEDTISGYLDTAGLPDPDLMIRTSGERGCLITCCGSWHIANFILPTCRGRILKKKNW